MVRVREGAVRTEPRRLPHAAAPVSLCVRTKAPDLPAGTLRRAHWPARVGRRRPFPEAASAEQLQPTHTFLCACVHVRMCTDIDYSFKKRRETQNPG